MRNQTAAYIGLGSNLGNRHDSIDRALKMLAESEQVEVARVSDVVETAPLGQADQPKYLNAVAEVRTTLSGEDLYERLIDIEASLGRVRREKWASRTIDLDLLLFGRDVINLPHLTVPHSQMHLRSFVLSGLCQLDPNLLHPVLNEPVNELAARLAGSDFVLNPDQPQLVSVAGIIGVGKTTLAKTLSSYFGCKLLLEPYDTNPYMPDVYAGKKEFALDSQLYFLTSRICQLSGDMLSPGQFPVTDYVFDKELIYARRLLDNQQLDLYEKLYYPCSAQVTAPVLLLYLRDSAQKCLERIHDRNRPYEQRIQLQFLEALTFDYERLFADWKVCPVIRISVSQFDCARHSDIEHLAKQVRHYIACSSVIASSPQADEAI
ncbi:MAG: 2-amino-4-hydroxy-6-hydroxymethyldihydropteridine diphosphokinase [Planctomycetes bacterium]|nr:2-amino-4-hydroxy-6-hydroxymethyldihydropteridine diphosphokinase [Planctomycetota bacterium]